MSQKWEQISRLSLGEKRALLAQLAGKTKRDKTRPLSSAQQRLWLHDQLIAGEAAYVISAGIRIRGQLNVTALEESINEIVRRHEALRTTFRVIDGQPVQVIAAVLHVALELIDLQPLAAAEREAEAMKASKEESQGLFNLAQGPLLRTKLLRLEEEEHVFLLTMHHIISDGWSMQLFFSELVTLYVAFSEGQSSPLEELPIQYSDYARWEREALSGELLESQLNYWKQQLKGAPASLQFPTDNPRPAAQSLRGASHRFVLSEQLTRDLRSFSHREQATLFMTLVAAFQILLSRYSGEEDIVIGTDTANRSHAETEGLIGFFINQLVLRTNLSGDPTVRDVLAQVNDVCLSAYSHQRLPFEKVVEELNPKRSTGTTPLFQTKIILQAPPAPLSVKTTLEVVQFELENQLAIYELLLNLTELREQLRGQFDYNVDLFNAATIERLAKNFETLLESMVADPLRRISQLPLLAPAERQQLLFEWNETTRPYPQGKCLHELFQEQVACAPDAVAVVCEKEQLTFADLDAQSNQVAHYLQRLGIGPEVRVGILMESSIELIVALLGVLKAGGTYVPLDPHYPLARLSFILNDAGIGVLLTQEALVEKLPFHGAQVVCLDTEWETVASESVESPISNVTPENLAYIIYTSGSTGTPKGVMVGHAGVANLCTAQRLAFEISADSRVLQFASLSFDASVSEIFVTLLAGATLYLAAPDSRLPGPGLIQLLRENTITAVTLPPSVLALLPAEDLPDLRCVIAAGESCSAAIVERWSEDRRFLNAYGPTEASVCASIAVRGSDGPRNIIGRPMANTRIFLLDAHLQPVPIGAAGELFISGAGLARGYVNQPALTAEKFLPDPFSRTPGARLYRTGDLARYLSSGDIEFIGRRDEQIKLRGYRIELGEIEAVLAAHQSVRQAVVIRSESERLVGFVVLENAGTVSSQKLRQYAGEQLPEYMVPAVVVELDQLPVTSNGKIDRRALAVTATEVKAEAAVEYVAPRNQFEEMLAGIWASLLHLELVGVFDDFFDLGGHSLLATQVISRVKELFKVDLSLRHIFDSPTVAALVPIIEAAFKENLPLANTPLRHVARQGALPMSYAQQRLWFVGQMDRTSAAYNVAIAMRVTGRLDQTLLEQAFREVVRRHEVLRTTFRTVDGEPVQVIGAAAAQALELTDLSQLEEAQREAEVERLARADAERPFDLSSGPLMRASLLCGGEAEHVLLLTMHHIISDGWSMGVLVREVAALYEAYVKGAESPLAELEFQYADYAVWQREYLEGDVLEQQLAYWKQQLGGAPPVLELPSEKARPKLQTHDGAVVQVKLSAESSRELRELSRGAGVTLFMTLLAAFQLLLARYTGQEDVVVGTPIANRTRAETEPLIGFFVNMLVLRTDLSGNPTFTELLGRVREVCLGAYAHQELPFEKLVEELQPERDLSHTPLFQVLFELFTPDTEPINLPELSVSYLPTLQTVAKFDLRVVVAESAEQLSAVFEYNRELFDEDLMQVLARRFQSLLESIAAQPQAPLSHFTLLLPEEQRELLIELNQTASEFDREATVQESFERQVERTPEAIAVEYEKEQLSYRELNERANQVAAFLKSQGLGSQMVVALYLDHGLLAMVSLLGVLKSGASYLPLDANESLARVMLILADAQASVVVTQAALAERLPVGLIPVISLDSEWPQITQLSKKNPASTVNSGELAYVIYTSGSTGQPKGVMVSHRAVVNYLTWAAKMYLRGENFSFALYSSLAFDLTVTSIYLPLVTGNRVVVYGEGEGAVRLEQVVRENRVGVLKLTPSHLAVASESWKGESLLKRVIVGGEALERRLAQRVQAQLGEKVEIWNEYGPTEATVGCVSYLYRTTGEEAEPAQRSTVPIGRAGANVQVYLLDAEMRVVGKHMPGELYLGGEGLAEGYLNQPALTADKFVPDPFSATPGARLYRTGDLARYLSSGDIEFIGRRDEQIKLRGYRIELGEIEAVLAAHRSVRQAVVIRSESERLVGFVVLENAGTVSSQKLRQYAGEQLPEYMVPAVVVELDQLPVTSNGKIDRRALSARAISGTESGDSFVGPRTDVEQQIAKIWQEILRLEKVGINDNFFDLGGHSLLLTQVSAKLIEAFGEELTMVEMFQYPTITSLAERLTRDQDKQFSIQSTRDSEASHATMPSTSLSSRKKDIAIIGMNGQFPGARNISEFWQNLRNGVESISFFSDEELLASGIDPAVLADPNYVKAGAVLDDIDRFDASFFGFSPREAEIMDPQHRIFLECAWKALEDAGYDSERYTGPIGVFAGLGMNSYLYNIYTNGEVTRWVDPFQVGLGNDKDFLPTRVSYKLNLKGPSMAVQTACSTSLVAVHLAIQSLLSGDSDICLAGGVSISAVQKAGYIYREGGIASPDGHCRAFDAQAQGTIGGAGVGIVVLKRLGDALLDRDHIHAVIKGSAINNDGSLKVGYTAPSVEGQARVIRAAQLMAEVTADSISYVEAHGTATALGDPIEVAALTTAFRATSGRKQYCALGSVKTNVGHLDTAAGVTGLIKTVLALQHQELPPSLHYQTPNPAIDFGNSPFYVNQELRGWPRNGGPRRAGVSSFGIGGTNAHVIVEEAPEWEESGAGAEWAGWEVVVLSGQTASAVEVMTERLREHLERTPGVALRDVAFTLQEGRRAMKYRRAVICHSLDEAIAVLETRHPRYCLTSKHEVKPRHLVFMFSGQGSQYVNMGRDLYSTQPRFRSVVDECARLLEPHLGVDLRNVLYPAAELASTAAEQLKQTRLTQPALFMIEYALAQLWSECGVEPDAMIGHSLGEYVAACLSGVFSLEDALRLVAVRGELMQKAPPGAMIAVPLSEEEVYEWLKSRRLSLAAVNGTKLCVVSGEMDQVVQVERDLSAAGIESQRLETSHAFHSEMMESAVDQFVAEVKKVDLRSPQKPYLSNVTGGWIRADQATDPRYWGRQMRETVRFGEGIKELKKKGDMLLVEVGPGQTLSTLVKREIRASGEAGAELEVVTSLRKGRDEGHEEEQWLRTVSDAWVKGAGVRWEQVAERRDARRIQLPTYPFERARYWVEAGRREFVGQEKLRKKEDIAEWFYVPVWKRKDQQALFEKNNGEGRERNWLIFVDECGVGAHIATQLEKQGGLVNTVHGGERFAKIGDRAYVVNPKSRDDYQAVLKDIRARGEEPQSIIHLWSVFVEDEIRDTQEAFRKSQVVGFHSLITLAQALAKEHLTNPLQLFVVADRIHEVSGEESVCPQKATLLGACKVIPQEYPHISCRSLDVIVPLPGSAQEKSLVEQLVKEVTGKSADGVVAYRNRHRWVLDYEAAPPAGTPSTTPRLRENGVYLITGGLGRIGLILAEYLAKKVRARLILLGRSSLPGRESWQEWLNEHDDEAISRTIRKVQELETEGAEVLVLTADVSNEEEMRQVVARAEEQFGLINGVIHGAGISGAHLFLEIYDTEITRCEQQFRPKVDGVFVLDKVFRDKELDFCLLLSSLSSVLGGLGFAAYAASNIFMDAFAQYQNQVNAAPWISVNWDGWKLHEDVDPVQGFGANLAELAITPTEGARVFERILSIAPVQQVIISTGDLQTRIEQWGKIDSQAIEAAETSTPYQRPDLQSDYVAPRNEIEQQITQVWQELLGIKSIGIHDNFFDLGGHSLLATQVVSRLAKTFQAVIPLRTLIEESTVAGLSEKVRTILTGDQSTPLPPIKHVSRDANIPLSFAQQRLWFVEQLEPNSLTYVIPGGIRLHGWLDIAALERTLSEIIRRHEVLRTTFAIVDGQPVQVIAPAYELHLSPTDLSHLAEATRQTEVERLATEEAQRPFDLSLGPLLRVRLFRLGEQEHVVLLMMHHIISDGWSLGVLIREVATLYDAFTQEADSPLPELAIQYADYAVWQREYLQGEVLDEQLAYWKQQLAGAPPVLKLPADHQPPKLLTHGGSASHVEFSSELSSALKDLSRREDVTLFMTLLAAFQLLLARYSGQEDIVVGTPIANRTHAETEPLIGFFINMLVLRTDLSGNPTFTELLRRVREVCLGAYAHQELPFEKLVEELQPERKLGRNPLFNVVFGLHNAPTVNLELRDLQLGALTPNLRTAKYDWLFSLSETDTGMICSLEYKTDIFDPATIARVLDHYHLLLRSIASHADAPLDYLTTILTQADQQQRQREEKVFEDVRRSKLKSIKRKALV